MGVSAQAEQPGPIEVISLTLSATSIAYAPGQRQSQKPNDVLQARHKEEIMLRILVPTVALALGAALAQPSVRADGRRSVITVRRRRKAAPPRSARQGPPHQGRGQALEPGQSHRLPARPGSSATRNLTPRPSTTRRARRASTGSRHEYRRREAQVQRDHHADPHSASQRRRQGRADSDVGHPLGGAVARARRASPRLLVGAAESNSISPLPEQTAGSQVLPASRSRPLRGHLSPCCSTAPPVCRRRAQSRD